MIDYTFLDMGLKMSQLIWIARCGILLVFVLFMRVLWQLFQLLRRKSSGGGSLALNIVFVGCVGYAVFTILPNVVDMNLNSKPKGKAPLQEVLPQTKELFPTLFVADFHADSLLWKRELRTRHSFGHVDLPRLRAGNIALQTFTLVSGTPQNLNYDSNQEPSLLQDSLTLKALAEGWGVAAVVARAPRVAHQVAKLMRAVEEEKGAFMVVRSKREMQTLVKARRKDEEKEEGGLRVTGAFLGIEGLHALDGNLSNVDYFHEMGIRMMGPAHFFDNDVSGSAHGINKGGLTVFGRDVVARMQEKGIFVDVAHASEKTIDDVLKLATLPVISSHTGAQSVCDSPRNLKDEHIIGIANTGGILAVGFFEPAVCGIDLIESVVDTIEHIRDITSIENVALGSDWDGTILTPVDSTELIHIADALFRRGFSENEIRKVMGDNMKDFLLKHLQ